MQSLNEAIEEAMMRLNFQLKSWTTIRLTQDLAPNLPLAMCDRNQIAQVILKLLTSAHDSMPDGGTVTLKTRRTLAGVALEVSDTGFGLRAEALS